MLNWRKGSGEDSKKSGTKANKSAQIQEQKEVEHTSASTGSGERTSSHRRLGELLLEEGLLTLEQLAEALKIQDEQGGFLGKILVEKGFVTQEAVSSCLTKQCRIPHINLGDYDISPEVLKLIPEEVCRTRFLIPIDKLGRILTVGMVDPLDTESLEEIKKFVPDLRIKPILCSWDDLQKVFEKVFQRKEQRFDFEFKLEDKTGGEDESDVTTAEEIKREEEIPVEAQEEIVEGIEEVISELKKQGSSPEAPRFQESPISHVSKFSSPTVVIDTSVVQAIQELPSVLANSIRESLSQVSINVPTPSPQVNVGIDERFFEMLGELRATFRDSIEGLAKEIRMQLTENNIENQTQLVSMIRDSIGGVFQEALATMIIQLKSELAVREKGARENIETVAEVIKEGFSQLSSQLLSAVSQEIQQSMATTNQATSEMVKILRESFEKIGNTRDDNALTTEKMSEILLAVRDSIVDGIQSTLEKTVIQLTAEQQKDKSSSDMGTTIVLSHMTDAIKMLNKAVSDTQKQQEVQLNMLNQIAEQIIHNLKQNATFTVEELKKQIETENKKKEEQERLILPVIPELKEVVNQLRETMEKTQEIHSQQTEKIAQLTETTLESVQQTTQLVETLTIMEGKRLETLEEKKRRLSSVSPFGKKSSEPPPEIEESDKEVWQALESEQPLETLTFENFFPGTVNSFTFQLSKAVAEHPGVEYNPFFLYGNVGVGKTHLISAIGNEILKKHPQLRVGYVSASHFSRRLSEALRENALDLFRENYCHWDVLILDDIQFMGGKVEAQEEFFHVFNVLYQSKRQIIIASDKAPDRLGMLEQRLVSRFASGIVAELKAPEWETRMQILRNQMKLAGVKVPEEVLSLIAMRVPNDVRKMTGSLKKIIAFAKLVGQNITCEMADEILSHLGAAA